MKITREMAIVRRLIQAGTYETEERISGTVDKALAAITDGHGNPPSVANVAIVPHRPPLAESDGCAPSGDASAGVDVRIVGEVSRG